MQFHLNGFKLGDPNVLHAKAVPELPQPRMAPAEVDVLIVGCGPAGLTLATQLAAFPDIRTAIVEQKDGPLQLGQADGIACRTLEMFHAFGFGERVEQEAYWVNETSFWKPDDQLRDHIRRSGRIRDTEDGLSECPHVILNQARIHDFYLERMRNSAAQLEPHYSRRLLNLEISSDTATDYPVTVRLERTDSDHAGQFETIRARYVVGCDGARSEVRKSLNRVLTGDAANQAWGVMDVLAVTNFPDVRLKAVIHSAKEGSALIIPREGGYLTRFYIELDKLNENERVSALKITSDQLIAAAQRILHPYTLDVKEIAWWSVYEIGQRLCDKFDDVPAEQMEERHPRVFIAGDACHTHSPKAGQGMNVSMQDAFNLGWKLAAVLRGQCRPQLLHSYSAERQSIAKELIDFDREFAAMFSMPPKDDDHPNGVDPTEFQAYFMKQGRFTAGTATRYMPSKLTGPDTHQHLAAGLPIGMRFHSAPVIRLVDAKPLHLGHVIEADGRWRIFAFAGSQSPSDDSAPIRSLCDYLMASPNSPLRRYTPTAADIDSVIDVRAVIQQDHRDLDINDMPPLLAPRKGRYGLIDYEKAFCPDFAAGQDIFDMRKIDRVRGALIIVRPDQYVAHILPLTAHAEVSAFFDGFMIARD